MLDVRLPGMSGLAAMDHFRQAVGSRADHHHHGLRRSGHGGGSRPQRGIRVPAEAVRPDGGPAGDSSVRWRASSPVRRLPPRLPHPPADGEEPIVGHSAAIQEVFKRIALVAPSDACVHLRGESGTGKELAARAIHRYSRRSGGPFVAVNVASLSPSLAESELFGHARGAFTGADQPRKGLLEQAHGGTIFLDEVADIPLPLQVKLLRVLEHGEILPVGGDRPVQSDFRLISATHQDLRQRVAEGAFRHDLYYRLITFEIEIPPLRQRRDDIPELAAHFPATPLATRKGESDRSSRPAISAEALAELQRREWFGNVRELRNAIEHAMILARGGIIAPEHLPPPMAGGKRGQVQFAGTAVRAAHNWTCPLFPPEEAIVSLVRQWAELQLRRPGRRRRPLRSLLEVCGAAAVAGGDGALRRAMSGRRPPARPAPHDAAQEARRTRHRRCVKRPHWGKGKRDDRQAGEFAVSVEDLSPFGSI